MGRQHQGMDRPGVRQVPDGSGEQGKIEKTGCEIICGAPTTLAVKGLMMMMIRPGISQFYKTRYFPVFIRPGNSPVFISTTCFPVSIRADISQCL